MSEKEEKKKPVPLETKIGERKGVYDGVFRIFEVYYGNALSPVLDGEMLHLETGEYRKMLEEFLESEEGKEYERPSEEEILSSIEEVISSTRQIELKRKEELYESEREELYRKDAAFHESIDRKGERILEQLEEMKKRQDTLYKRMRILLIIETIGLVLLGVLLALALKNAFPVILFPDSG